MPIVFGHSVFAGGVQHVNNTWGLDTGACHGLSLSALILPQGDVVSVPAEQDHYHRQLERHREAIAALEVEQRQARAAERRQRKQKAPPPSRPAPIVIEGQTIDGKWLLAETGQKPGPWLAKALASVRNAHEAGRLRRLDDVRALL